MRNNIKALIITAAILFASVISSVNSYAQAELIDGVTMIGAGDIANCSHVNDEATAKIIDSVPNASVFTLGDNVYPDGSPTQFTQCYGPTWGRFKDRTKPVVGNHDYHTSGASGFANYFGLPVGKLYYSYNYGGWHVIVLDSESSLADNTAQMTWLKNDLAQNSLNCTMAMYHHPRWSTGNHGDSTRSAVAWQVMYDRGVDLVLNGHDHLYERYKPQNPQGQFDPTGITELLVGTGGAGLYPFQSVNPNTAVRNNTTFGVIKLTLSATDFSWQFMPVAGGNFNDSGSANCVNTRNGGVVVTPVVATKTKTPIVSRTPTLSRTPTKTRTATVTRTPTKTKLPTKTATITKTPSKTPTASRTPTPSATFTFTPTFIETVSPTVTETFTPTETATPTVTFTATETETSSPIPSETSIVPTLPTIIPTIELINYQPSSEDIKNPERGFMKQSSIYPNLPFDQNKIRALQPTDSLVWVYFRLDAYNNKPLDAYGLNVIEQVFNTARSKGLKIVVRFNYNGGIGSTPDPSQAIPDAPIEIVRQHLQQLAPIIAKHVDVIDVVQVGFVGHWGEWHSSKYLHDIQYRKEIVDTLLDIVPTTRMLMLRYPRYHQIFFGSPVNSLEAFTGTDKSRVGIHDDCFLCDDVDGGTYQSTTGQLPKHTSTYCDSVSDKIACWKAYVSQQTTYSPFGGEASKVNPPRTDCSSAMVEMDNVNLSFLNNGFSPLVLSTWTNQGCMDDIRLRMGYRFVLKTANIPLSVASGTPLNVSIKIKNEGFASPYNPRPVFLVLLGQNIRYNLPVPSINLRHLRGGLEQTYNISVNIPNNVPAGIYKLGLWIPDDSNSLAFNPAYSIRTANTGTWDSATGINILKTNLLVLRTSTAFVESQTYYVSPFGKDSNDCSINNPCTYKEAEKKVQEGETIFFQDGTYPAFVINKDGIKVITENAKVVTNLNTGIIISANGVTLSGFEVSGGNSYGIYVDKDNFVIENNKVHNNVENNRLGSTSCGVVSSGWGSAIKVRIGGKNGTIRNNTVWNNCGEGIAVTRGANVLVDGNILYSNYSVNIYIDNSYNVVVANNKASCLGGGIYLRNGYRAQGIAVGSEFYSGWGYQLHDLLVRDNSVDGCFRGMIIWPSNVGGILKNVTIRHNDFVDQVFRGLSLDEQRNLNVLVENNTVYDSIWVRSKKGVTLRGNIVIAK